MTTVEVTFIELMKYYFIEITLIFYYSYLSKSIRGTTRLVPKKHFLKCLIDTDTWASSRASESTLKMLKHIGIYFIFIKPPLYMNCFVQGGLSPKTDIFQP